MTIPVKKVVIEVTFPSVLIFKIIILNNRQELYSCLNVLVSVLVSPVGNGAEKSKRDASFR